MNPISLKGCLSIIKAVEKNPNGEVNFIDLWVRTQTFYICDFSIFLPMFCDKMGIGVVLGGHTSFSEPLILPFWISGDISSGFQSHIRILYYTLYIYSYTLPNIPQDRSLVEHLLISWLPPVTYIHVRSYLFRVKSHSQGRDFRILDLDLHFDCSL